LKPHLFPDVMMFGK